MTTRMVKSSLRSVLLMASLVAFAAGTATASPRTATYKGYIELTNKRASVPIDVTLFRGSAATENSEAIISALVTQHFGGRGGSEYVTSFYPRVSVNPRTGMLQLASSTSNILLNGSFNEAGTELRGSVRSISAGVIGEFSANAAGTVRAQAEEIAELGGHYDGVCFFKIRGLTYDVRSLSLIAMPSEAEPSPTSPYGRFHIRGSLNCNRDRERIVCGGIKEGTYDAYRGILTLRTELFRIQCEKTGNRLSCPLPEASAPCNLVRRAK